MTEADRAASDLEFVRQVVERRGDRRNLSPRWLGILWGTILLIGALLSVALGVIGELLKINQILVEETLERLKKIQYGDR